MSVKSFISIAVLGAAAGWATVALRAQDSGLAVTIYYGAVRAEAKRICYGNGMFLASSRYLYAAPGGTTSLSPDGFHWTPHGVTNGIVVGTSYGVCAGSSNFVAYGNSETYYADPAGTNGLIQFSSDGVVWAQPVTIPSVPLAGLAYASGTYVAAGQGGGAAAAVVTSSDGVSWSVRTFPGYGSLRSVTWGAGRFVAVGSAGAVFTSSDGSNWLTQTVLSGADISSVAYGSGIFVAAAPAAALSPSVLTSTNGTNWANYPLTPAGYSIAYGNGLFVGIDADVWVSTNGVNWIRVWTGGGALSTLDGVAYGAGTFDVLWNEGSLINISPSAFLGWGGKTSGAVDLTLTGGWLGQSCRLQAASSLPASNWVDLLTFTNQGSTTHVQDPGATNYSRRFYRVAMP